MKQNIFNFVAIICLISITSCVKDSGKQTYKLYRPIIETTISLRAKIKSSNALPVSNAGKLFLIGNYIFLNERSKGIHVIDNTNPSNPINISFINIPGNIDMSVTGNTLYADCYTDLITFDITNPLNVVVKNTVEDIFDDVRSNQGFYTNAGNVVTGWNEKDTTIDLQIGEGQGIWTNGGYVSNGGGIVALGGGQIFNSGNFPSATGAIGKAGSMSRFALMNNYLYTVSHSSLNVLNISNAQQPTVVGKQAIGWQIETIYPFKDKLFIGSTTGMQIFKVDNPAQPTFISSFAHARLCDPVIADDDYAYVTLHSGGNACQGTQNELDVIDVKDIYAPNLISRTNLTKPMGLSKDGNTLLVCDDDSGIRVFDATNPHNLILKQSIPLNKSYDIICNNGVAVVSARDGIHQYNYKNIDNVIKLSKFNY
jgi:hypothetical protein